MFQANCYNVMIVSPSDVSEEREVAKNLLYKWNEINSRTRCITFSVLGYDINAHADSGCHPQESLNHQLLEQADLIIAIFWTKLGTPTTEYSSGSVEEISKHIEQGKKAFIYFSNKVVDPVKLDTEQYKKLQEYKASIKGNAFYKEFSTDDKFRQLLNEDIQLIANELDPLRGNSMINSLMDSMREVLKEYDVPKLSDEDLKIVKENIEEVPEEYRARLFGFDVFGLPRTMLIGKESDEGLDFFKSATVLWNKLNAMLLNQASKDIRNLIESNIKVLMPSAKIDLSFLSFFAYYVNRCAISILSSKSLPASVSEIMFSPESLDHPDEIEEKCMNRVLEAFRRLKVNSPSVTGNMSEFMESIWEYSFLHCKVNRQFENKLRPLKPFCDQIISSILEKYGKYPKTFIMHDLSIWDSSKYMDNVAKTMKSWKQESQLEATTSNLKIK